MSALSQTNPPLTAQERPLEQVLNQPTYRCRVRPYDAECAGDTALDGFIQIKAPTAERAMLLAQQVTGLAVVDATRIEA